MSSQGKASKAVSFAADVDIKYVENIYTPADFYDECFDYEDEDEDKNETVVVPISETVHKYVNYDEAFEVGKYSDTVCNKK